MTYLYQILNNKLSHIIQAEYESGFPFDQDVTYRISSDAKIHK